MAKCEDCEQPVVWIRKPDGGWLPPVEPILDFAYNDHYTASVDGVAQPVPQIYKKHECLSWEERQLKLLERQREKQALIEADRARRAEAQRVAQELEEARRAQEEAEREVAAQAEREERQRRAKQAARRREKEAERVLALRIDQWPARLLAHPCRDCNAEVGEPCRTSLWRTKTEPYLWWRSEGHNSRYADSPPDDRSKLIVPERWGEDYQGELGTTPETVGPWPPPKSDPGRYDMQYWLRRHYIDVFEPERRWLTDGEQSDLTDWLEAFGGIFEEPIDDIEEAARGLYEKANEPLRHHTIAAWVRWEDVTVDCRAAWMAEAERKHKRETPKDEGPYNPADVL